MIQTRRILAVAPLRDEGQARSYLVAVGTVLPGRAPVDELESLVVGFGAPWHCEEVILLATSDRASFQRLPASLLLRDEILACDWASDDGQLQVPRELVLETGRGTTILREDTPQLVAAEKARRAAGEPPDSIIPFGEGALWRTARALILVDLDELERGLAEAAARLALGDTLTASTRGPLDQAIESRHAQAWDSRRGVFFSPEETQHRRDQERKDAAARLGAEYYGAPVLFDEGERRSVRTALRAGADLAGTTPRSLWRETRANGVTEALNTVLPETAGSFFAELSKAPTPVKFLTARFPSFLARTVSAARRVLYDRVSKALLGGAHAHRSYGSARRRVQDEGRQEAFMLSQLGREEMLKAMNLSPVEADLVQALEDGVFVTVWAAERGIPLSEARRMRDDLRGRLGDLQDSMN